MSRTTDETLVLALIPARSGSKSVPDKNVRELGGKPLLAHSIEQARAARRVDRVIVSTDSEHYAAIARSFGAETPFLRPVELATDAATDLVVFEHALDWLHRHEGREPDILVHLRPTCPDRDPADIDRVVELLLGDPTLDAVRSIAPAPATPYKMWTRGADDLLEPVADLGIEAYNLPRQQLPRVYLQNACIDAVRGRVIREQHSMTGRRIRGYPMQRDLDVDTHADLERVRAALRHATPAAGAGQRRIAVDLGSVLATAPGPAPADPEPRHDVVAALTRLHDAGVHITVVADDAARATAWLARWGVPCQQVSCTRLAADYLVDGRAVGIDEFLRIAAAMVSHSLSR